MCSYLSETAGQSEQVPKLCTAGLEGIRTVGSRWALGRKQVAVSPSKASLLHRAPDLFTRDRFAEGSLLISMEEFCPRLWETHYLKHFGHLTIAVNTLEQTHSDFVMLTCDFAQTISIAQPLRAGLSTSVRDPETDETASHPAAHSQLERAHSQLHRNVVTGTVPAGRRGKGRLACLGGGKNRGTWEEIMLR